MRYCDETALERIYENAILSPKSFETLVKENSFKFDDILYHATSIQCIYSILTGGEFTLNDHGVTNEETISTSLNDNITQYFSKDKHNGVFIFNFNKNPINVFSLPEWFLALHTEAGFEFQVSQEECEQLAREYNIPVDRFGDIQRHYLANNLPKDVPAFCLNYVHEKYIKTGRPPSRQDEAEITFLNPSVMMNNILSIVVDGEEFDNAKECLAYLKKHYASDYLTHSVEDF